MEFKLSNYDYQFRVKRMSAVEVLAIKSSISLDSVDKATQCFNEILERIEVKVSENWVPVKIKNLSNLTPVCLEEDISALREIVDFFIMTYLKTVFTKSNESKN